MSLKSCGIRATLHPLQRRCYSSTTTSRSTTVSDAAAAEAQWRTRYVGEGYLLRPWDFGGRNARGVTALEVGTRILHPAAPVFADLAAGAAVLHGDGGVTVGPVLRLQLGVAFRGRGIRH